MRDVADKSALGRNQRFDLLRHVIKITAEVGNLIVLLNGRLSHTSGKISASQLPRRFAEPPDRCSYLARQPEANKPRDQKDSGDAKKLPPGFGLQKVGDRMSVSLKD